MATFDVVVERATGVAAGMCVAALGGTGVLQSLGGAAVAGVGLYGVFLEATKKCRVECDRQLGKLAREVKARLIAENPAFSDHYEDASHRLSQLLLVSFPTAQQIAALAVAEDGAIVAATNAVLEDLNAKGAGLDRDIEYERFARAVVSEAIAVSFADRDYFPKLEPHLWFEALKALGAIKIDTEAILASQEAHGAVLEEILAATRRVGSNSADDFRRIEPLAATDLPPTVAELVKQARDLLDEGQYAAGRDMYATAAAEGERLNSPAGKVEGRIGEARARILMEHDLQKARESLAILLRDEQSEASVRQKQTILCLLGDAEVSLGNVEEARSIFSEGRRQAAKNDDGESEAHHLVGLSHVEELSGNLDAAHDHLTSAIGLYRASHRTAVGDDARRTATTNLAATLASKAALLRHTSNTTEALGYVSQAETLFREVKNTDNIGRTLLLKAELLLDQARWNDAAQELVEALELFESLDSPAWQCRCLDRLARLYFQTDDKKAASACLARALIVADAGRDIADTVPYLLKLARVFYANNKKDEAVALVQRASDIADQSADEWQIACSLMARAEVTPKLSDEGRRALLSAAAKRIEQALPRLEVKGRRAEYMRRIGELSAAQGHFQEATLWARRALSLHREIGDVPGIAETLGMLAALAREQEDLGEAAQKLSDLIDLCRSKGLPHHLAGASHDLGALMLSQGNLAEAARNFGTARELSERHDFRDVLDAVKQSTERLEQAKRFYKPPDRDYPALFSELRDWCLKFPDSRLAILPLWYHMHGAELWGILRSQAGVKFLVCEGTSAGFAQAARTLRAQGDQYVWALNFSIKAQRRTEIVPWSDDALVPLHMKIAGFRGDAPSSEARARALVEALSDETYILLPFSGAHPSFPHETKFFAFGRHLRLPVKIARFMLDTPISDLVQRSWICLPIAENEKQASLSRCMLAAWENGAVATFSGRLPHGDNVQAVCDATMGLPVLDPDNCADASAALKNAWLELLAGCVDRPQQSLLNFKREIESVLANEATIPTVLVRAYLLTFSAGGRDVVHPAIVTK